VKRTVRLRLHDITEAIDGIESTVAGMTFADTSKAGKPDARSNAASRSSLRPVATSPTN
jgi:hypothetical protein